MREGLGKELPVVLCKSQNCFEPRPALVIFAMAWRPNDIELHRPLGIIHRRGAELGKTSSRFIQLLLEKAGSDSLNGAECEHKHEHDGNGKRQVIEGSSD